MAIDTEADGDSVAAGALDGLAGYHLRRAHGRFAADFARTVAGTGMRQVLFGILSVVDANPGINQGAAGRMLGVQRANMVSLINETVDAGWIDRQVADDDRRAFALNLTEAGRETLGRTLEKLQAHEEALLAGLSAGERATLIELLRRIVRAGD
jgi:DNA-binding MarR family transcriptional regulator